MARGKVSVDHLGNVYPSLTKMCEAYPVKDSETYRVRIKAGMSVEDALTTPIGINKKESVDHLGNKFPSRRSMCLHWDIPVAVFVVRVERLGWGLKKALTTPPHETEWVPVEGPDGIKYENTSAMCRALGISRSAYDRRKNNENQIEDTIKMRTVHTCNDGFGNEFPSISAMCKHYGISRDLYYYRVHDLHMPIYEALITPTNVPLKRVVDRIGEEYVPNNGCPFKIIAATSDRDVTVEFLDGTIVKTNYSVNIARGAVKHPTLKVKGTGSFAGFITKNAFKEDEKVYYTCRCTCCEYKDILTPLQMLEHFTLHS